MSIKLKKITLKGEDINLQVLITDPNNDEQDQQR